MRKAALIIFSAPSGSGKTTIVRSLMAKFPWLKFSVSATTREPRPGEQDGIDYHFLSETEFAKRIDSGEFAEWEEVYPGRFYGTLRSEINSILQSGNSAIFDIDVIGGLNLKEIYGQKALAVFIQPPSLATLEERLRKRETEDQADLERRITKAKQEMEFAPRFDKILVNDNLDLAIEQAESLLLNFVA